MIEIEQLQKWYHWYTGPLFVDNILSDTTESMNNLLWSSHYSFAFLWIPKAACSTLRSLFWNIHKHLHHFCQKKTFEQQYPNTTHHTVHHLIEFQHPSSNHTHVFCLIRHPFHRLISVFLDKHVLQQDSRYLSCFNYRRFQLFLYMKHLPYTFRSYLLYLNEYKCIDVHDLCQWKQIPFHHLFSLQKWASLITVDIDTIQTQWSFLYEKRNIYHRGRWTHPRNTTIHLDLHVLTCHLENDLTHFLHTHGVSPIPSIPHLRKTPKQHLSDQKDVADWTVAQLWEFKNSQGQFPSVESFISTTEPLLTNVCQDDLRFFSFYFQQPLSSYL